MRAFNAFTSSGISAVICSAVVTDLSPLLLFGEGKGDSVLNPFGVPLPREPRKLYVLLGEVFDLALTDEPGHLLRKCRGHSRVSSGRPSGRRPSPRTSRTGQPHHRRAPHRWHCGPPPADGRIRRPPCTWPPQSGPSSGRG